MKLPGSIVHRTTMRNEVDNKPVVTLTSGQLSIGFDVKAVGVVIVVMTSPAPTKETQMWFRFDGALGRLASIGAVATIGVGLARCGGNGEDGLSLTSVTVDLDEVNDSGLSGQVLLASAGANRTIVIVALGGEELPTGDFPAAIHEGTCGGLSGNEAYPLDSLRSGLLSQEISASLDDLRNDDHSLVVFQSDNRAVYVACADL